MEWVRETNVERGYSHPPFSRFQAANSIADAERVQFFSEGASGAMASYGVSIFSYAGIYCNEQTDPAFQIMSASYLGEKDAVVAISHSGQSVNLFDTLHEVKANNVPVICITGYKDSALKKYADVILAANLKRPVYFSELPAGRLRTPAYRGKTRKF